MLPQARYGTPLPIGVPGGPAGGPGGPIALLQGNINRQRQNADYDRSSSTHLVIMELHEYDSFHVMSEI